MTRYAFKITLVGDGAVGKTSLRRRFMGQAFIANHLSTIGADFSAQKVFLENDDEVEFQVWDLAGQMNFKSIRSRFYSGTRGALCVFDVTSRDSFMNIPRWIDECFTNTGVGEVPIILIGNKIDLDDQRVVSREEAENYAEILRSKLTDPVVYFETSAKTGENVRTAFQHFATQLRDLSIAETS
ncbi:MAG: Rab family GTPase [Candidatus Kariarchaeaceae archaeon]|jgi:small GTP-binding protein